MRFAWLMWVWLFVAILPTTAQGLARCSDRPTQVLLPRSRAGFCVELVYHEQQAGELAFTALAFTSDGTLFATRPLYGQLLILKDTNGDFLPDSPQVIAENLSLPNALTVYDDGVYIAGGTAIYRWQNNTLTTLIDDLPSGSGLWNGGITVFEGRLIVGVGAPCNWCYFDAQTHGLLLSFALDGSDRQILATGLRQPTALGVYGGQLWVGDSAPYGTPVMARDELQVVVRGADYGFPRCTEGAIAYDITATSNCNTIVKPDYLFKPFAMPISMVEYTGEAFADLQGKLLLLLAGTPNRSDPSGFELMAFIPVTERDQTEFDTLVPHDPSISFNVEYTYGTMREGLGYYINPDSELLTRRGAGFYPHQPLSVAISPEGWIYIAISGGRIYALRPV
jgi:glucose/arabinose dehydrogenase